MEGFESAGVWWLPTAPEARVVGLLRYSDSDGFRLEIPFGLLGEMGDFADRLNASTRTPLVHGQLRNGKTVTLVEAVLTFSNLSFPGACREEHRALKGYVGQVEADANPQVDQLRVRYSHLRDWVVRHPATCSRAIEGDRLAPAVDYRYEAPEPADIASGDGWRLRLSHIATQSAPSVTGFRVDHDCVLTLELDEPLDLEAIETRFLAPLWQFLSFCLDRSVDTTSLSIRVAENEEWLEVGRAQTVSSKRDDVVFEPFMLLPMPQLGERLGAIMEQWFAFKGDECRAVSLMVGLSSERSVPSDLKFLAAAQALEAMSRVGANETELTEDEFQRRLTVMSEAIPEPRVRDWAARKLQYANQRSAGELLRDLLTAVGDYPGSVAPDLDKFLSDLRNNRNFYTHRDDRRVGELLAPGELFVLTQGLILLLKAATLHRLGFSAQEISAAMNDCQGSLQWRQRVAEQYAVAGDLGLTRGST